MSPCDKDRLEPLFFYMPDADFGEFCQWYPSEFTLYNKEVSDLVGHTIGDPNTEITFNCAEQFMMFCKAARFHDIPRQALIMATQSPKEQKRLGKLTVGFTDHSWDEIKSRVVEAGNMAKFGQNIHLQRKLLSTGDRLLCEAASRDRMWGIGYTAKHAMSHRKHWGENRLGQALMVVRGRLREMGDEASVFRSWDRSKWVKSGKQD
ncbi:N-glycosidase R617 [Paramyrothecium foliicola]|nr:N-glycosidase R617 [Paramyrothecium foliicola]